MQPEYFWKLLWHSVKKMSVPEVMLSSFLIKLTLKPPFLQSSFLCSWTIAVRSQQGLLMEFSVRKTFLYFLGQLSLLLSQKKRWLTTNYPMIFACRLTVVRNYWVLLSQDVSKRSIVVMRWLFATFTPCWDTF